MPKQWIVQRCTQEWRGTELLYEDWPGLSERAMDYDTMIEELRRVEAAEPHEFRGHNVANCRCPEHRHFKTAA